MQYMSYNPLNKELLLSSVRISLEQMEVGAQACQVNFIAVFFLDTFEINLMHTYLE